MEAVGLKRFHLVGESLGACVSSSYGATYPHKLDSLTLLCPPSQCTVEPTNNGHIGDECFVHCSEVVPSLKVEMYGYIGRGREEFVNEFVNSSEVEMN